MALGFDTNSPLSLRIINEMLAKHPDIKFVVRYVGEPNNFKNITPGEVNLIFRETDWYLMLVFETDPVSRRYFQKSKPVSEGGLAAHYAIVAGASRCAIYCTVDYDAPAEDLPLILSYVDQFQSGVRMENPNQRVGVYGSGLVVDACRSRFGGNMLTWLSLSPGWAGYDVKHDHNLVQREGGSYPCSYDLDDSDGDAGGWRPPKTS